MKSENYIAFFTVCGFFISLLLASYNIDDPIYLVIFIIFGTYAFYLVIHMVVINFIDAKKLGYRAFDKERIEGEINLICEALTAREGRIEKARESVDEEIRIIREQLPNSIKRSS